MRHITTNIYDVLTGLDTDETQWITEDPFHPGTFCLSTADAVPEGWQLVSPEELESRRDDQEDEYARQQEARRLAAQAWDDAEADRLWQERRPY